MPAFNWITFLERYHIEYADHGPNVGPDHVVIKCPFCGNQDPGMHLSISTTGKGWHCWRNNHHAGINPNRLIMQLLNIDFASAAAISGTSKGYQSQSPVQAQSLAQKIKDMLSPSTPTPTQPDIDFPKTARSLDSHLPVAAPYRLYLKGRGISRLDHLAQWDMRFDHHDPRWHGRILFAVRHASRIVALTGRAISRRAEPRYLAEGAVDRYLIWADRFPQQANLLVLTEGPFDALKLNLLGNSHGIWSTCCMTSSYSKAQQALLYELIPRFQRAVVLFDQGNEVSAYRLAANFPNRLQPLQLPSYAKDPAELTSIDWLLDDEEDRDD